MTPCAVRYPRDRSMVRSPFWLPQKDPRNTAKGYLEPVLTMVCVLGVCLAISVEQQSCRVSREPEFSRTRAPQSIFLTPHCWWPLTVGCSACRLRDLAHHGGSELQTRQAPFRAKACFSSQASSANEHHPAPRPPLRIFARGNCLRSERQRNASSGPRGSPVTAQDNDLAAT